MFFPSFHDEIGDNKKWEKNAFILCKKTEEGK